jgi:hypothetical protein
MPPLIIIWGKTKYNRKSILGCEIKGKILKMYEDTEKVLGKRMKINEILIR